MLKDFERRWNLSLNDPAVGADEERPVLREVGLEEFVDRLIEGANRTRRPDPTLQIIAECFHDYRQISGVDVGNVVVDVPRVEQEKGLAWFGPIGIDRRGAQSELDQLLGIPGDRVAGAH